MSEFTTQLRTIKTRKEHHCDCFDRLMDSGNSVDDIPEKYRKSAKRLLENWGNIPAGSECYTWSGKFDGEMFTAYADKDMYKLVCEMGWFDS